ncbi:MAG: LytTR family DNA-binding domain-containing protein [Bacteroidales bacterium]|nr:LytTR family DNA-binding domain-containing protein [Bacteroidales bacterium]
MIIKAVIIDDEPGMQVVNSRLLTEYFPEITIVGKAESIESAYGLIKAQTPDLVLLDIELADGSGFELLQKLQPYTFNVVFITGFDAFAIQAFKYSALDYLLKPLNPIDFQEAISRAVNLIKNKASTNPQLEVLMQAINKQMHHKKLVLKTTESMHIVEIDSIYFCKSDNSYTTFYFENDPKILVSKSLKEYESLLAHHGFFRAHQSYLVNLNHVSKVDKSDGGFIIMNNEREIPISSRQMKKLVSLLEQL